MSKYILLPLLSILISYSPERNKPEPLHIDEVVKGWIILSDDVHEGFKVIDQSSDYGINHLQISHHLIHDLKHVRDPKRLEKADFLVNYAHSKGIREVVLWDRALYELDYYPDRFKTGPNGTINLDNTAFWEWFKDDYREMLDLVPNIQGLILTFIETGARVEDQYSRKLKSNQEKLAAVVNAVASVVIEERGLNLYARTFSYTYEEYENITGAIDLFEYPEIRLMMKETPHDFFLTHPNDFFAGTIDRPTIIEFDTGAEFNGQGVIANTWPEHILDRWSDFLDRDHIIGYAARTDRYGDTRIVGRPSEINLYALKRYLEDRSVTVDDMYDEFITLTYNEKALPFIKNAFKNSFDIITSTLYTLGTSTADHSKLNYDPYPSHWARHVSGKWLDPPVVYVAHGVNREFHYWKDIVNILAPDWAKAGGTQLDEIPWVMENGWLTRGEKMNEEFLSYVMTEKAYGVSLAEASLVEITKAKPYLPEDQYTELYDYFNRTLITARLHKAVSTLYFGYRIYARGESFRNPGLIEIIDNALAESKEISGIIKSYDKKVPVGEWNWREDANMALRYCEWIEKGTWPGKTRGYATNLHGIAFRKSLPRSTPEAEEVSVKGIADYMDAVKKSGQDLHSLMILRHGKVVAEHWWGDHAADKPHIMNSVSKTFTATAIGFAVSEGKLKLTDKVISFFPDKLPANVSQDLKDLDIKHLLTMSVGHDPGAVREKTRNNDDWVAAFLAAPITEKPGTQFNYNSIATYMLSAIIQEVTGEKLINYLYPRLFRPLGIAGATWEECPQGVNIGGWGLYLKTEDMAKFGQFLLQKGKWNGVQLLPESWIDETTTSHIASLPAGIRREELKIKPENSDWLQGYGYQVWRCRHNSYRAAGAHGQFIIVLPEKDGVIVTTAHIGNMQEQLNLIWEYLLPAM